MKKIILIVAMVALGMGLKSQDFVYTPVNPAFGGNTFNYQWMLSSANAQNNLTDPDISSEIDRFRRDPLDDFESQINRQILSRLSTAIVDEQLGTTGGGLAPGNYVFGDYTVSVGTSAEGISIIITDNATGNATEVVVPTF